MDEQRRASHGVMAALSNLTRLGLVGAIASASCVSSPSRSAEASPKASSRPPAVTPPAPSRPAAVVERPSHPLTLAEARRYMVALINRDRATQGLAPVTLDEGPPSVAGQVHADDMARLGYLGHWGSDGSVPEQRHTDAGGADMVLENALCFTDEARRTLDPAAKFDPTRIERAEALFFDEVPPNDGHRRNILRAGHTRVGIGIAQPVGTATEIAVPCVTQEFTDGYGTYAPLPRRAKVGTVVHVEGVLSADAEPTGVGVARAPTPQPLPTSELNRRRSYPVPKPFQSYWGPGFVSPIPVRIDGRRFAIDVPLSEGGKPGLYEVSVWAHLRGSKEQSMVSVRTIVVE